MADRGTGKRSFGALVLQALTMIAVLSCYAWVFAAEHGGGGAHGPSTALWWDLVWRILNFTILAVVLFKVLKKPLSSLLSGRQASLKDKFDELDKQKAEAEGKYAEYEKKLATIEQEVKTVVQGYIEQGEAEKNRIIEEAHKAAGLIKQQAQFAIEQEMNRARLALRAEVADLSVKLAEELIKKNITEADHKQLIDEYIAKVVHTN